MVILGIDPGTATTGYGVIESSGDKIKHIAHGCIKTEAKLPAAERLEEIFNDLSALIKKYRPDTVSVELVYFQSNVKTAISVAQSRGVILFCARRHKLPVAEFTPLQVKNTLTNFGRAEKKQVQFMVKTILDLKNAPKPDDAADALAVAVCAANTGSFSKV